MGIFVNRILNMKHIKAIGFDMDYTLVRYKSRIFEQMTYQEMINKLVTNKGYPVALRNFKLQYDQTMRGLVVDKLLGNILKLSLHSKVKQSYHGLTELDFKTQQKIYQGFSVDLNDSNRFAIVDTIFSMAYSVLYMQLVDFKDKNPSSPIPDYKQIEHDVLEAMDLSHRDGTLKGEVRKNVKKYIEQDANIVAVLEKFKKHDKKLWVITNSDFDYCKLLMDYTINPFLKEHKNWQELFDLVITTAAKPRFFVDKLPFLKVDPKTSLMSNHHGPVVKGIYQGGCASTLQRDSNLTGEDILYLGDHIYGDILSLKKACNWRTALVIEELEEELKGLDQVNDISKEINLLMNQKSKLEHRLEQEYDLSEGKNKRNRSNVLFKEIEGIDKELSKLISKYQKYFNPHWGELMRAGVEPSRLAGQIEKYACVYMAKISDFEDYSPRTYFRPRKRPLPHENV